jgi:hypothetical protein
MSDSGPTFIVDKSKGGHWRVTLDKYRRAPDGWSGR